MLEVASHLYKHANGHHCHVRFASGIVDEVQIDHFLNFKYRNVHDVDNVGKQWRHVVSHSHISNNLLHHCLLLCVLGVPFVGIELCSKLLYFACIISVRN